MFGKHLLIANRTLSIISNHFFLFEQKKSNSKLSIFILIPGVIQTQQDPKNGFQKESTPCLPATTYKV